MGALWRLHASGVGLTPINAQPVVLAKNGGQFPPDAIHAVNTDGE
jgi:hypothetical protein